MNLDLPNHAADKVRRALNDVHQLTSDPAEKLRIALLASSICIGQASGILAAMMKINGVDVSETDAKSQIMDMIRIAVTQGPDAAWEALSRADR